MKRIFLLDWGNSEAEQIYSKLCSQYPMVTRLTVATTLADSIRQCAIVSDTYYFWVASSLTDYSNFDFNMYSEKGLEPYLQVFGHNTWLANQNHIKAMPMTFEPIEAFPDLHFVKQSNLKSIESLLDIVYISNEEPRAEEHYQHLLKTVKTGNKIHRISGINGRTAAYQAAARASETAWFFAVFAKIEVNPTFDWTWHPDQTSGPKHYIFYAQNPVNDLNYGHMAVVAYNKSLTCNTVSTGLDFLMSKPHEVIPVNSGIARFDMSALVTWRTAFRESIKLKQSGHEEDLKRLESWLTIGNENYGMWSKFGAQDAIEYFNQVNGNYEKLMLSYEWSWLNQYYYQKYK